MSTHDIVLEDATIDAARRAVAVLKDQGFNARLRMKFIPHEVSSNLYQESPRTAATRPTPGYAIPDFQWPNLSRTRENYQSRIAIPESQNQDQTEESKKRYPNGKQSCYKGSNSHDSSRCLLDSESETLSGESTCFVGKGKRRATDPKPKEQRRSKDTMIPRRRDSGRRKSTRGPGSESELTDFDTWIRRFEQRKRCKSSGHRRGSNERRRSRSPSSRHKSFIQRYREYASENPAMASRRRACLICSDQGRLGACWNCGRKTGGLR